MIALNVSRNQIIISCYYLCQLIYFYQLNSFKKGKTETGEKKILSQIKLKGSIIRGYADLSY